MFLPARQRQPMLCILVQIDNLVPLGQEDDGAPRRPSWEQPPRIVLVRQGRVLDAGHKGRHEARVVEDHPADVAEHPVLERFGGLAGGGVGGLGGGDFGEGVGGRRVCCCSGGLAFRRGDGSLQSPLGKDGDELLGDEARVESPVGHGAKALATDQTSRGEQDQRLDEVRHRVGKVQRDAAAERVAHHPKTGVRTRPGEAARGQDEEDLREVEALVVGEVAYAVGEAAAEEVLDGGSWLVYRRVLKR